MLCHSEVEGRGKGIFLISSIASRPMLKFLCFFVHINEKHVVDPSVPFRFPCATIEPT